MTTLKLVEDTILSPDRKLSDVTMLRKFKGDAFVSCRFILNDRNKISIAAKGDLDLICLRKIFCCCCLEDHMKKTNISSTRFLKIMFLPSTRKIVSTVSYKSNFTLALTSCTGLNPACKISLWCSPSATFVPIIKVKIN